MKIQIILISLVIKLGVYGTKLKANAIGTDETIEENSSGKAVIDAVLMKIKLSNIFSPDHEMLDRIAWTESHYGTDADTYRGGNGGIWQVDKVVFETIMKGLNDEGSEISKKKLEMIDKFDINWENVVYEDLKKPFYSGIAARLFLLKQEMTIKIPELLTEQGKYYEKLYNPNGTNRKRSAEKYLRDSEELQKTRCQNGANKIDIVFVLDGSGSVGWVDFKSSKSTIGKMASKFSLEKSRIGFVVYSSMAFEIFSLSKFSTTENLKESIMKADYPGAGTMTNLGIDLATDILTRNNNGSDSSAVFVNTPKIMVVYTDGLSSYPDRTKLSADSAKEKGVILLSIGIGKKINHSELNYIGGGGLGTGQRSFETESFKSLDEKTCLLTKAVQDIPKEPPFNFTVEEVLYKGESQNYAYEIPTEGIIVTIDNMNGKVEAYYSYTIATPNQAFNDGKISGQTIVKKRDPRRKRRSVVDEKENSKHGAKIIEDSVYISVYGVQNVSKYTILAEVADDVPFNSADRFKTHFILFTFFPMMYVQF